jgi:hypothetical protein
MGISDRLKSINIRKCYPAVVVTILFLLAFNIRWKTLRDFCFIFTDSDQLVLWDAANDMHHGIFHEPCFYGQAYNPLFEPLFAQPFIALGFPLQVALPLVSGILGFLPYFILGWFLFRRKKYISAAFAFALLLWLPIEFQVISSIPRGYIPATAFAAIGVCLGLFTKGRFRFFWFAFFSAFAFFTSENAVFLIVPAGIFLFLHQIKNPKFYIQSISGFVAALPLPLFVHWFYAVHPAYNMHELEFTFDWDTFLENLGHTDLFFKDMTPDQGHKLLIIIAFYILFASITFYKKNIKAAISILSGLVILMFVLSFDKTQDASESLFFSAARMFLSIPVSYILFCYWAEDSFSPATVYRKAGLGIISVLLIAGFLSSLERNRYFQQHLFHYSRKPDAIVEDWVSESKLFCDRTFELSKKYHSNLVIIDNWMVHVNYMMAALNYPVKTLVPSYERRTWELQAEDTTTRDNFIYYPQDSTKMSKEIVKNIHFQKIDDSPAYLIQTGGRRAFDILKEMQVPVRPH